jgi:hypothetical protein
MITIHTFWLHYHSSQGHINAAVIDTPSFLNQYSFITTQGGRFILGEKPATSESTQTSRLTMLDRI